MGLVATKIQPFVADARQGEESQTHKKRRGKRAAAPQSGTPSLFEQACGRQACGQQSAQTDGTEEQSRIVGILSDIRHHKPDSQWGIFQITDERDMRHIVKGVLENPRLGMDVVAFGEFVDDPRFGRQFDANVIVESLPEPDAWNHREKVAKSLASLPHMTPLRFGQLWDQYGRGLRKHLGKPEDVVSVLRNPVIPIAHAREMSEAFLERGRFDRLHLFIAGLGAGHGVVKKIVRHFDAIHGQGKWDVDACIAQYRANPYGMVDVKGMGFLTVDVMALKMKGYHPEHPHRLRAALLFVLAEMVTANGDTAIPASAWAEMATGKSVLRLEGCTLQGGDAAVSRASLALKKHAQDLMDEKKVAVYAHSARGVQDVLYVADYWMFHAEKNVALHLYGMMRRHGGVVDAHVLASAMEHTVLSRSQRSAVALALAQRVGVLTGGPGTGKTTCVKAILDAAANMNLTCALCAPTGKAASRLTDVTGYQATTIHSLIKKAPGGDAQYNEANPYPAKLFVVDEASMVDTKLMSALISAIPPDAGLLLVGDIRQLPSVGPGQVLSDIVASKWFPVGVLTENFRQMQDPRGGAIPAAADLVAGGHFYGVLKPWAVNVTPEDFRGYHGYATDDGSADAMSPSIVLQEITRLVREAMRRGIPARDIQVLSPMRKNELGITQINFQLQRVMNRENMDKPGLSFQRRKEDAEAWTWHFGDRAVLTKNHPDIGVYNGDTGEVVAVYPAFLAISSPETERMGITAANFSPFIVVRFRVPSDGAAAELGLARRDPETGVWTTDVRVDAEMAKHLEPSYAMTIHKTQGSEYPLVIMALHTQHWIMCNRALLYTGMTRAKKGLILLAASKAVRRAVATPGNTRTTLLLKIMSSGSVS
jgi:exodeoxyribonuclease V alpha subunit